MVRPFKMTPQDKKRHSYIKDRRNTYGENAKSSRKNISRNKRTRSRTERRVARQPFTGNSIDFEEDRIDAALARSELLHRESWKKFPDEPLGTVVERKLHRRSRPEAP